MELYKISEEVAMKETCKKVAQPETECLLLLLNITTTVGIFSYLGATKCPKFKQQYH
jgi:hypothetical protein